MSALWGLVTKHDCCISAFDIKRLILIELISSNDDACKDIRVNVRTARALVQPCFKTRD